MKIQSISEYNTNFKMRFKFSDGTLKAISESTRLSVDELRELPLDESTRLMKERGAYKEPNKLFQWLAEKYKKFGEKTGLLQKQYEFYSDGD